MPIIYFATQLSDNISITPPVGAIGKPGDSDYQPGVPGYLICRDVVIARDGWQRYRVSELDQKEAAAIGIDLSDLSAYINIYRPADEVFSASTISSFEGMPITDDHPQEFVARDNWRDVACGHVQNVRKGPSALDSGDWPMLADLVITVDPLATDVEQARKRQVSCGYTHSLARDQERILQVNIRGNHVAVVDKARAGPEARIYDSVGPTLSAADLWEGQIQDSKSDTKLDIKPEARQSPTKEKATVTNWFKHVTGLGLKALAADADTKPADLTDAVRAIARARDSEEESEEEKERKAKDAAAEEERKKAEDAKRAKDEAEEKEKKEREEKEAADRKAARDAAYEAGGEPMSLKDAFAADVEFYWDPANQKAVPIRNSSGYSKRKAGDSKDNEPQHFSPCAVKDCMDRDCAAHRALDGILEAHPKKEGEDADMEELMEVLKQFEGAPNGDSSEIIEPVGEGSVSDPTGDRRATDAQANDAGERQFLKLIRPTVARSTDSELRAMGFPTRKEFDARVKALRPSRQGNGTYDRFAGAAGTRRPKSAVNRDGSPDYSELQAAMDAARGKAIGEVR